MRVLYVSDTLEPATGAAYKVLAIAQEWERQGHLVWFTTTRNTRVLTLGELTAQLAARPRTRGLPERVRGELAFRVSYPFELAWSAAKVRADVVFCRELPPAPGLRSVMRRWPFVLEMNGNVGRELPWYSLDRATRVWSRRRQVADAAGVVFVSRELKRECEPAARRAIVIGNPSLPIASLPARVRPERPTLVLAGYLKHASSGMDKFVALARALPELDFLAIGAELPGPQNLRSLAPVPQGEADRLMSGCTVGVGPLAAHRQGVFEASPLKSRNYLALGLPVIQAYEDTDLSADQACVLQLPNCEDNVLPHVQQIRRFAWRAFEDDGLSRAARALALGPLSLAEKERTRLQFIEVCLSPGR